MEEEVKQEPQEEYVEPETMRCPKCGRTKKAKIGFYSRKDRTREPICKECLTMFIDNTDRTTFEGILEKFDVPYIEEEGIKIYNNLVKKNKKIDSGSILGIYLRSMKMAQYNKYSYADSEQLNFESTKNKADIAARQLAQDPEASKLLLSLQKQLDEGDITQAQFDTLNPITFSEEETEKMGFLDTPEALGAEREEEIIKSLSEDEITNLRRKGGNNYKPSQWLYMEELYIQYENQFELNVDRIVALKQICKLDLEMNECLAIKDYKSYRDLSSQLDTIRKSAKFTDAQNKDDKTTYLDSIGELVRFCEQEKGLIEMMPNPDDYPQDKIDFTIKDIKKYIQDLVKGELGLGALIESYIKKLEKKEEQDALNMEIKLNSELADEDFVQQEEAEEWHLHLEDDVAEEAAMLANLGEK